MRLNTEVDRPTLLDELDIAASVPEASFDRIVMLAADLFDAPIALVTLFDAEHQWLKAKVGVDLTKMPRSESFCTHTILSDDVMVVPDARLDHRFRDLPLVADPQGVRFYAGAPLKAEDGCRIGAVCVLDRRPRVDFSDRDRGRLTVLARMAMGEIEQRRRRRVAAIAKDFVDRTDDIFVCTHVDGRIVYVNQAVERLFGYGAAEMTGQDIAMIIPERFREAHRKGMARVADGEAAKLAGKTIEAIGLHKDGNEVWIDLTLNIWRDERGVLVGATMRDITNRKAKTERLKRLAHYDTLTGLARGHLFEERVEQTLKAEGRAAVLVMEIDGLVDVNDSLGHHIGDALLQAIAIRLIGAVPHGSKVARWGGDVFAVLLTRDCDAAGIIERALDLQVVLAEPFLLDGHTIVIGATVGAAFAPDHARLPGELIAAADLALHHAKSEKGQRVRLFEWSMQASSTMRRALRDEVRLGLDADQFAMFYQPQVSLEAGVLVGAEALMRWHHPTRGLLSPGDFIPAMDDSALALQAGWWTLDQVCRRIARRRIEGRSALRISVNLFAAQLRYGGLVATVRDLLDTHGVPPELLELEVRETIANQDDDAVIAVLRELSEIGVGIALDDFGTGYASLKTLQRLPVSTLKIDQSFVRNMCDDRHDAAIVAGVLGVGKGFGLDVIAEGVETVAQAALLAEMGCPTAQGHLYGRAMSAPVFDTLWSVPAVSDVPSSPAVFDHSPAMVVANRRSYR